ncbi:LysR substrate-binding domain-containing protein [Sorangium sp. So ce1036]|uniref:LysR substrate-binding domain-containing protein n=1 Tax=Sorangium sp. So ce1036 TaxID=3133328 RepID=UPI003F0B4CCA
MLPVGVARWRRALDGRRRAQAAGRRAADLHLLGRPRRRPAIDLERSAGETVHVTIPAYLARHEPPRSPEDLAQHNCLTFHVNHRRHVAWRFEKDGAWTEVRVDGDRDADDAAIAHPWALAGAGLLYKAELDLVHDLREGRLVRLLPGWQGEHYPLNAILPSHRFVPARVRALVDFLAAKLRDLSPQKRGVPGARGLKR